mmetsp:Transcript_28085/g.61482  ORF Transcript_28085/g.61482 Transcript_28085/m.61482 type:complete len:326 (+) Transcript_28085:675-1652(+)
MRLHQQVVAGEGQDLGPEVVAGGVLLCEEVEQHVLLEDVDAHGGNVGGGLGRLRVQPQDGGVHLHGLELVAGGLLGEGNDAAGVVDLHEAEVGGAGVVHGQAGHGDVGAHGAVGADELGVVHAVQVVAGQDDHVLDLLVLDVGQQPRVLADGISGALEPLLVGGGLGGGQHLHEALGPDGALAVRAGQVAVEGHGVELGEHVDLGDAAVEAVGHGHINQAVRATDGHRGLGALLGQGVQARAGATTEDDGQHGLGEGLSHFGSGCVNGSGGHGGRGGGLHSLLLLHGPGHGHRGARAVERGSPGGQARLGAHHLRCHHSLGSHLC